MTKAYQFPVKAVKGVKVKPPTNRAKSEGNGESVTVLGSRMEDWGYYALLALGWPEEDLVAQRGVDGGRAMPGGQVVDLVLYTPLSYGFSFKGEFWHSKSNEETWDDARAARFFDKYFIIWWKDAFTYDMMYQVMLERVGRP